MMEHYAETFVGRLDVDDSVEALEVGAGSGAITGTLAGRVKSLLATDFAPGMLELLRERMKDHAHVECRLMDGQALELDDDSFDRAACCFALMLFPDRARGFSELNRVVRPGGRAVVTGWAGPDRFEAFAIFLTAFNRAFPDLPPPPSPPPVFSLANLEAFRGEMEAAGFQDVETEYVSRELEVDDFDMMWPMLTAGAPPVQMLFDRVGADGEARIRDQLAEVVSERFGSGPIRLTNVATLGTGLAS
jgi:SAM-dependent methyltransferase